MCLEGVDEVFGGSGDIWGAEPFIDKEYADCYLGVFWGGFLCQLSFPDPIMVQLSRHLPVHQVAKFKHTNHAIVVPTNTRTVGAVLAETLLNIKYFLLFCSETS